MKRIFVFLVCVLIFVSCSSGFSFTENEDNTVTRSDGTVYYPLENSHRYSHLGKTAKSDDVLILEKDSIVVVGEKYYVTEEYKSLDVLFEECTEYFFVERKELKSLEINIEKGIYLLNGVELKGISRLDIDFNNGKWSLLVTKDELYVQAATEIKG